MVTPAQKRQDLLRRRALEDLGIDIEGTPKPSTGPAAIPSTEGTPKPSTGPAAIPSTEGTPKPSTVPKPTPTFTFKARPTTTGIAQLDVVEKPHPVITKAGEFVVAGTPLGLLPSRAVSPPPRLTVPKAGPVAAVVTAAAVQAALQNTDKVAAGYGRLKSLVIGDPTASELIQPTRPVGIPYDASPAAALVIPPTQRIGPGDSEITGPLPPDFAPVAVPRDLPGFDRTPPAGVSNLYDLTRLSIAADDDLLQDLRTVKRDDLAVLVAVAAPAEQQKLVDLLGRSASGRAAVAEANAVAIPWHQAVDQAMNDSAHRGRLRRLNEATLRSFLVADAAGQQVASQGYSPQQSRDPNVLAAVIGQTITAPVAGTEIKTFTAPVARPDLFTSTQPATVTGRGEQLPEGFWDRRAATVGGVQYFSPVARPEPFTFTQPATVPETFTPTLPATVPETFTPTLPATVPETFTPTKPATVTQPATVPETFTPTIPRTVPETFTPTIPRTVPETFTPTIPRTVPETFTPTLPATVPSVKVPQIGKPPLPPFKLPGGQQLPAGIYAHVVEWGQGTTKVRADLQTGRVNWSDRDADGRTPQQTFRVLSYTTKPPRDQHISMGFEDVFFSKAGVSFTLKNQPPPAPPAVRRRGIRRA